MVSKSSLLEAVKAFDWKAVDAGLLERPDLLSHREEREKNWLHVLCSTRLQGRKPAASIKTADVLLERGIDLHARAFTEGKWKATPVWWCVAWGRNLPLAEHLLKLRGTPHYSMFAACWNDDVAALDLLLKYGALVEADGISYHAEEGIGLRAFRDVGEVRCAWRHTGDRWEDGCRDHVAQEGRAVLKAGEEAGCGWLRVQCGISRSAPDVYGCFSSHVIASTESVKNFDVTPYCL